MAEFIEESGSGALESTTIGVFRSAATVKGGKRFSFGAMVVVGDRRGRVGLGYAKAKEVPPAIEKAQKDGKKNLTAVTLQSGTIPHAVQGTYSASIVRLIPASPGTGVVAGATVRSVLEMAGITDCLTKAYGSTNKKNLAKATIEGLAQLRTKNSVATLRGVTIEKSEVDDILERGAAFVPAKKSGEAMRGPVNTVGQDKRGGGRGGRGGRGGGGGGGGGRGRQHSSPAQSSEGAGSGS